MKPREISLEYVTYTVIFLLALTIRLAGIEQRPLTDPEASLALQTLALARGESVQISSQPAYLAFTTLWMFLFGSADWTARFWPAITGSLLVLIPCLYRKWLGKLPALIMALFIALDPGLLAASLQADGLIMAVFFLLSALGLALAGKPALAGVAAGLALLSGPAVWQGALGLGLAVWLAAVRSGSPLEGVGREFIKSLAWRRMLIFALAAVFFAGTLFFTIPRGLSAMAASLPDYLTGWVKPSGVPALLVFLGMILYEFLPLLLGVWRGAGGLLRRDPLDAFLFIWWAAAFLLALVYPGRQVTGLVWPVIPLAGLAARQAVRVFQIPDGDRLAVIGQALLSALILGFISLTVLSIVNNPQFAGSQEYWFRLAGALAMLLASTGLIGWGWSRTVALRGSIWGVLAVVILYAAAAAWNSTGLSSRQGREFWAPGRQLPEEHLLLKTIKNLSEWGPVVSGGPDLVVAGVESPALRWALRNHSKTSYVSQLSKDAGPSLVITAEQPDLALAATYRGQDFVLNEIPAWNSLKFGQWLRWLAFRTLPEEAVQRERFVLWARTDLFPGGEVQLLPAPEDSVQPVAPE